MNSAHFLVRLPSIAFRRCHAAGDVLALAHRLLLQQPFAWLASLLVVIWLSPSLSVSTVRPTDRSAADASERLHRPAWQVADLRPTLLQAARPLDLGAGVPAPPSAPPLRSLAPRPADRLVF